MVAKFETALHPIHHNKRSMWFWVTYVSLNAYKTICMLMFYNSSLMNQPFTHNSKKEMYDVVLNKDMCIHYLIGYNSNFWQVTYKIVLQ